MKLCTVDDCEREHQALGLCALHYTRLRNTGTTDPRPTQPPRFCTVEGCGRKCRARGLCSTHYNQQHQPDRHKATTTQCAACGEPVLKQGSRGKRYRPTCSTMCRYYLQWGKWQASEIPTVCRLPNDHPVRSAIAEKKRPEKPRVLFVAGLCQDCGQPFVATQQASYCTRDCMVRYARRKRRAREANAPGDFRWIEVIGKFLANDRRCSYCMTQLRPDEQPDPDHVIPLSRGGTNHITNILPSCRLCNSDKRDLLLDVWVEDRARRGLSELPGVTKILVT